MMNNWQSRKEVKKGNIGERIVNEILSKKGYIVYKPINGGSHKIDFFAHKQDSDKKIICVEAKCKKRMAYYTKTGFNYSNYIHYKEIQDKYKIETYVYFIDDFEECVYGGWLNDFGEGTIKNDVIVWPLKNMELYRKLTNDEINEIKKYTTENYDYSLVGKYWVGQKMQKKLFEL